MGVSDERATGGTAHGRSSHHRCLNPASRHDSRTRRDSGLSSARHDRECRSLTLTLDTRTTLLGFVEVLNAGGTINLFVFACFWRTLFSKALSPKILLNLFRTITAEDGRRSLTRITNECVWRAEWRKIYADLLSALHRELTRERLVHNLVSWTHQRQCRIISLDPELPQIDWEKI
jgi:hypothetical protein